jgi:predicted acylesterase/phospholipase RssA
MKFINMYLVGYVVLVLGLALGLWQVGVLQALAPVWIAISLIVAIGLGIMFSVAAGKPSGTTIQS